MLQKISKLRFLMKQVRQPPELMWTRSMLRRGRWYWEELTTWWDTITDDQCPTWRLFTSTDSTVWVCQSRTYKHARNQRGVTNLERSSRRERWGRPSRPDISVKLVKLTSVMPASPQCVVPTMSSSSVLPTFIASRHFIKFSIPANQTIKHEGNSFHFYIHIIFTHQSSFIAIVCTWYL